jgi:AAA ATPase domain
MQVDSCNEYVCWWRLPQLLEAQKGESLSSSPIRGRDEHLDMLTGFLQRVGTGTGGVVIIEGDAGLGKTRLLAAARETARALEFRTGLGTAESGHGSVLMEALFGGADPLIDRSSLGSRDRSREEPFWLLVDIQTLMERAALRQPLVVCLDDVQWADAGCGFALRMLTQWLASLPVAWLIAVRPDQGAAPVRRALAGCGWRPAIRRLPRTR